MKRGRWVLAGGATAALLAATAVPALANTQKNVTLVVAEWTNPPAIKVTQLIDQKFEKLHPGVTIDLQYAPTAQGAWHTLFNTLLQSKRVDVLAQFAPGNFVPPSYMNESLNALQTLESTHQLMDLKHFPFMKYFIPGIQAGAAGINGGIYGAEMARYGNTGVFYNKTMFAKYHLSVPKTWNQFIHVCAVLQKHNITPLYVAGQSNMEGMVFNAIMNAQFPRANTTKLEYQLDNAFWHKKTSWNSPVWKKIMTRYQQASKYFEPNWSGVAQLNAPGQWAASSSAAMLVDGSWDGWTVKTANPKLNFGWFPIPGSNKVKNNKLFVANDLTWVIPTWAPQVNLAIQYLAFFSQPANYRLWENYVGSLPTERVSSNLPWMTTENQFVRQGRTQTGMSIAMPKNPPPLANFTGDESQLSPVGQYSVAELQKLATQQFQAAAIPSGS